jgi:hypothetical protein
MKIFSYEFLKIKSICSEAAAKTSIDSSRRHFIDAPVTATASTAHVQNQNYL